MSVYKKHKKIILINNYGGLVTVDEFIKIFLEADECLKKKINVTKLSLDELRTTRKETLKLLDEVE